MLACRVVDGVAISHRLDCHDAAVVLGSAVGHGVKVKGAVEGKADIDNDTDRSHVKITSHSSLKRHARLHLLDPLDDTGILLHRPREMGGRCREGSDDLLDRESLGAVKVRSVDVGSL